MAPGAAGPGAAAGAEPSGQRSREGRPWRVWVVPQLRDGKVSRVSWEAVAAAQRLAATLGGSPATVRAEAVLLGSGLDGVAEEMARRDLAAVHVADHPALAVYTPGAWIGVLAPAIAAEHPDFVLFPHTYQTVDFVPRLAQRCGAGLLPEVTGFTAAPASGPAEGDAATDGDPAGGGLVWTRPVLGGKLQSRVRVLGAGTVLVSVQSGSFSADGVAPAAAGAPAALVPVVVDPAEARPDREVLGYQEVTAQQVDLTKADIIVAVGRGVGGADKLGPVEELARALGAEIGASRPVIDSGWLPRERQIGSSGQTVAPRLYLAAGISGAIQHLVGMKGSSVIVAINKDPSAPIFNVADYGLVGDLHELVPALTAAVKAAKG
ncbi:MAG TPA: electron transfer flavoprotein subunit alpha/FixB family protein [Thermoanaerobaculia bacterium]|jgi:electron transfer flavoprotein alpha subunit|nr:electron transfer flavoprotein subunit alpha/FixB family protein [Thermoanaerobaculia bacterium]